MNRRSAAIPSESAPIDCERVFANMPVALLVTRQRVISDCNSAKVEGDFLWHRHADTDETFIVLEGELRIDFRAGPSGDGSIVLRAGQMAVVPKCVEHKTCAIAEAKLLLVEPRGVVNTGDGATGGRTVENDQWI